MPSYSIIIVIIISDWLVTQRRSMLHDRQRYFRHKCYVTDAHIRIIIIRWGIRLVLDLGSGFTSWLWSWCMSCLPFRFHYRLLHQGARYICYIVYAQGVRAFACVFWDFVQRGWSTRGCTTVAIPGDSRHTECRCDHLTNFALIMASGQTSRIWFLVFLELPVKLFWQPMMGKIGIVGTGRPVQF